MICISEHKLNTREHVAEAQAWAKYKGWKLYAPPAKTTDKRSASAGVGFICKPWLSVSNIGGLVSCDETRWTSCQIELRTKGPTNIVEIYGSARCVGYTQRVLEDIRVQLQATGLPSVIVGDLSWDVEECKQWMDAGLWKNMHNGREGFVH